LNEFCVCGCICALGSSVQHSPAAERW